MCFGGGAVVAVQLELLMYRSFFSTLVTWGGGGVGQGAHRTHPLLLKGAFNRYRHRTNCQIFRIARQIFGHPRLTPRPPSPLPTQVAENDHRRHRTGCSSRACQGGVGHGWSPPPPADAPPPGAGRCCALRRPAAPRSGRREPVARRHPGAVPEPPYLKGPGAVGDGKSRWVRSVHSRHTGARQAGFGGELCWSRWHARRGRRRPLEAAGC